MRGAKLLYQPQGINQALNDINKALQIDRRKLIIISRFLDIYLADGSAPECEESLLKAVSVDPKNISANLKLANLYLIVRDYKKVDQYVKRCSDSGNKNSL